MRPSAAIASLAGPVANGIGAALLPNDLVVFDAGYTGAQAAPDTVNNGAILNLAVRNGGTGSESVLASVTVGSGVAFHDANDRTGEDEIAVSPAGLIYYIRARSVGSPAVIYEDVVELNPVTGVRRVVSLGDNSSLGVTARDIYSLCYDYSTASLLIQIVNTNGSGAADTNKGIYRVNIATGARTLVMLDSTTANGVQVIGPNYLTTDPFGNIFYADSDSSTNNILHLVEIPVLADSSATYGSRKYIAGNNIGAQNGAPFDSVLRQLQIDNTQAVTLSGGLPANEYLITLDEGNSQTDSDIFRIPVATGDHVRIINSATNTGSAVFDLPASVQTDTTGRIYYIEQHNFANGNSNNVNTVNFIPAGTKTDTILSSAQNISQYGLTMRVVPPPTPTLAAGTTSNLASTTATLNGNVTADGGVQNAGIFQRGFVYAQTSANSAPRIGGTGVTQVSTLSLTTLPATQGQNLGAFTTNVTGLAQGTSYTFSAYARDFSGITYSTPVTFVTITAPTVTSPTATAITGVSATLGGNVTADGGATLTARGVVYSVTSVNATPVLGGTGVTNLPDASATTGVFTDGTGNNLANGTNYSFRAYATNAVGTSYSATGTFTTAALPTANAQSVTTAFNTAKAITLTGSDPNTPAQTLTYTVATAPTHGTLSGTAPNLTYTPTANYQGADSFTFTTTNTPGGLTSPAATVSITVTPGTPTANAQSVSVPFNTATAVTLTGADPDVPALTLTYSVQTNPTHGTLTGAAPNLTYTPTAGYQGADSFTFRVSNGTNTSANATVTLNVAAGTPTANAQSATTAFNTAKAITLTGADPDSPALTLTYAIVTNPGHGTLSGFNTSTGAITYTPTANYQGADAFAFSVTNGRKTSAAATVSITVTPGTPTANAQSVTATANAAKAITLSGTDPDSPALALTYTVATAPAHGTLSGTAPNLTYTPANNYAGADSFPFTATNGTNTSAPATVSITVTGIAPAITSANATVFNVGTSKTFTVTTTGALPPALSETGALPDGVSFHDNGDGTATLSGSPAAGSNGSYVITITAHNATAPDATQTFALGVNRPPTAGTVNVGATQNTATGVPVSSLLSAAADPDGDSLIVTAVSAASAQGGTVSLSAPGNGGTITYTSAAAFTGSDSFTYTLSDGRGGIATGTVNVTVTSGPFLKATSIGKTPTEVTVVYAGIPGNHYQPQFTDALESGSWTNDGPAMTADGAGGFTYVDGTQPQPERRFYRAIAVP